MILALLAAASAATPPLPSTPVGVSVFKEASQGLADRLGPASGALPEEVQDAVNLLLRSVTRNVARLEDTETSSTS